MCVLEFLFSKFAGNIPVCNLPGNLPREISVYIKELHFYLQNQKQNLIRSL